MPVIASRRRSIIIRVSVSFVETCFYAVSVGQHDRAPSWNKRNARGQVLMRALRAPLGRALSSMFVVFHFPRSKLIPFACSSLEPREICAGLPNDLRKILFVVRLGFAGGPGSYISVCHAFPSKRRLFGCGTTCALTCTWGAVQVFR